MTEGKKVPSRLEYAKMDRKWLKRLGFKESDIAYLRRSQDDLNSFKTVPRNKVVRSTKTW